jgi:hypothetical protein
MLHGSNHWQDFHFVLKDSGNEDDDWQREPTVYMGSKPW